MEILSTLAENLSVPALLMAASHLLQKCLPLVSESCNKRAVRLAKAEKKQSK